MYNIRTEISYIMYNIRTEIYMYNIVQEQKSTKTFDLITTKNYDRTLWSQDAQYNTHVCHGVKSLESQTPTTIKCIVK